MGGRQADGWPWVSLLGAFETGHMLTLWKSLALTKWLLGIALCKVREINSRHTAANPKLPVRSLSFVPAYGCTLQCTLFCTNVRSAEDWVHRQLASQVAQR